MKRGQAAIEFLMTYGWALLIILVAISALVYFGVLNSDRFLPERCDLPNGFSCLSFRITDDEILMVIQNNLGEDIVINDIEALDQSGNSKCTKSYTEAQGTLLNGEKGTFTLDTCSNGVEGKKVRATIKISYDDEEAIGRNRIGEIVGTVEES